MSDFDKSKDKLVSLIGSLDITDKIQLQVSIRNYDNRGPKISILKVGKKQDGTEWFSTTLDRLNPEQAAKLSLLMTAAAEWMSNPPKPEQKTVRVVRRERKAAQPTV